MACSPSTMDFSHRANPAAMSLRASGSVSAS
jgi:hypothetical protein